MANKNRLIYADVAKEMITSHANEFSDVLNRREKALLIGGGTSCIDKCPTIDAVEVVRCKDCKHCKKYTNRFDPTAKEHMLCKRIYDFAYGVEADDFCSYGERREGEC